MTPPALLPDLQVLHLVSRWLDVAPAGMTAVAGWMLFAGGSLVALHERVHRTTLLACPPMVSASLALAAISLGLGLLLSETYPAFVRWFCVPYAMLAVVAAVFSWAVHSATRQAGRE